MPEIILPGTYITVRDEGLITAGRVATGNIGIAGTASKGPVNKVQIIGTFTEAKEIFGEKDPWIDGEQNELTLIRALEQVFNNGGRTVYAVRTATSDVDTAAFEVKDADDNTLLTLSANSPGTWGNEITISISGDGDDPKTVVLIYGNVKETFTAPDAAVLADVINKSSSFISAEEGDENGTPTNIADEQFSGGNDGANAVADDYATSLTHLSKDIINIVLLAGQTVTADDASMSTVLKAHIDNASDNRRERIGVIGCNGTIDVQEIADARQNVSSDRLIFTAPGVKNLQGDNLTGAYTAAAIVGLLSSLPVQTSPTNKVLNVAGLAEEYTFSKLEKLVQEKVLAIEKKSGFRVVKGITTAENSAWRQITTRRIVDYAKYGVRSACNPYIGKLNNERVRGAMKSTIDAFLTRMVEDEALVGYELEVSATRAQEIQGIAMVTMTVQPTFSIDFVKVTMYLQ